MLLGFLNFIMGISGNSDYKALNVSISEHFILFYIYIYGESSYIKYAETLAKVVIISRKLVL